MPRKHISLFFTIEKKINNKNVVINIDDNPIEQIHKSKFLGVIINENLTGLII